MKINHIKWNDTAIAHIAAHGVEPEEVEDVCFGSSPLFLKAKYNRYFALGKTYGGRYLTIVFEYFGQNKAAVITARAMSASERELYNRR